MKKPTQKELVSRILERAKEDAMQFEVHDYIPYLDAEHAKIIFPANTHESIDASWVQGQWSEADIRKRITDYLPKAFDWANRKKDYETMRAFGHFIAWAWLLGDRDFSDELLEQDWVAFGKPSFRRIAERYGVSWVELDDGVLAEMPDLGVNIGRDGSLTVDLQHGERQQPMYGDDIVDAAWEHVREEPKN